MELYENNRNFRDYVDAVAKNPGADHGCRPVKVDEVLSWAITRCVGELYRETEKDAGAASTYMPVGECV